MYRSCNFRPPPPLFLNTKHKTCFGGLAAAPKPRACKAQHRTTRSAAKRKGFTLIELLVVVLIIGILASVALPQYTNAVHKARFTQVMTLAKAVKDAQERYYLENNAYATRFDELDIDMPPGGTIGEDGTHMYYSKFYCRLFGSKVYCTGTTTGYYSVGLDNTADKGKQWCVYDKNSENAKTRHKLCTSLGGVLDTSVSLGAWLFYQLP